MCAECTQGDDGLVSLFTREWIEIIPFVLFFFHRLSPSLRGSGLKYRALQKAALWGWSPSLRGSGLKWCNLVTGYTGAYCLPLYEGVDWNKSEVSNCNLVKVSLFTREWIEISRSSKSCSMGLVSLFTREWIEMVQSGDGLHGCLLSPSLRGSGLKLNDGDCL